jgi:NAD(P)-dependent dehydrogenase (short-subunit alcohol dehydrogenase family)
MATQVCSTSLKL